MPDNDFSTVAQFGPPGHIGAGGRGCAGVAVVCIEAAGFAE